MKKIIKTSEGKKFPATNEGLQSAVNSLKQQEEEKKPTDSEILKYDLQNNDRICKSFKEHEEKKYISVKAGVGDEWIIEEVVRRKGNEKTKKP